MAWPTPPNAGDLIEDTLIDAIIAAQSLWGGNVDAAGYELYNVSALSISGSAGTDRVLAFQTSGVDRFKIFVNLTGESGLNSGSNFYIYRYDDAGGTPTNVLSVERADGDMLFGQQSGQTYEFFANSAKSLHINEGIGSDGSRYGLAQMHTKSDGSSVGSALAFIRQGQAVVGFGYKHNSTSFGFGAGTTSNNFDPSWFYFDPGTGGIFMGTNVNTSVPGAGTRRVYVDGSGFLKLAV